MTKKDSAALLLIGLLALIAYSNAFHGEFQYDDDRLIRFNFALRDLSAWQNISRFEPFRPIPLWTYALNFTINQKDPVSYHIVDFLLHLSVTSLFYAFLRRLEAGFLVSFFSAALFAVHPMNTESVSYIASRPILLCALFYWSALLCFDTHLRRPAWFKAAGFFVFLVLALFSKEEAALIPGAALLFNYAFYGAESIKKHRVIHILSFLLVLGGVIFRLYNAYQIPHPFSVYIPTEMWIWLRYIWLAIFPVQLNVDHYVEPIHVAHWKFWLSVCVVGALLLAISKFRRNHRWMFFFGIWFFLNLTASSLIPLNDFMAEHRTYLSMFGFCACLAYTSSVARPKTRLLPFALSCLLMFYVAATWKRNEVWRKPITLWIDAVNKSPQKFRPHLNLAFTFFQIRAYDLALREYTIARSLNPTVPRVHAGLGFTMFELGRLEEAEGSFRMALELDPTYIDAKTGIGMIRFEEKQYEEALSYFVQVYPHRRESARLVAMMSYAYLKTGNIQEAARILLQAAKWDYRFTPIHGFVVESQNERALEQLQTIFAR